ncbi:hypothetical protein SLEP1_g28782 [Rubroshorea leprosula]|uniref:Uncharacterized protein n=1 Tax=Rubroshorea leprosula TaxID=152421 RepID=A0AAV5JXD0_9ROSI|nr:hypothetical protein SLEP1_g28782 [Rubroshorea leprosula]
MAPATMTSVIISYYGFGHIDSGHYFYHGYGHDRSGHTLFLSHTVILSIVGGGNKRKVTAERPEFTEGDCAFSKFLLSYVNCWN